MSPATVRCVGCSDGFHVMMLDAQGRLCHKIRNNGGEWTEWGRLGDVGLSIFDCGSVGNSLHVIAVTIEGVLVHNIRFVDGQWQGWGPVPGQPLLDPFGDQME